MTGPTQQEVADALSHLGNWRVLHVQQACYPYHPIPASAMLGIGLRETSLRNICGGATWDPDRQKWVQAYTDRGWLQISDQIAEEARWLATVPGCKNGEWWPAVPPVSALTEMHCPRFSDALEFVKASMLRDMEFAAEHGVASKDLLRFAIAAHNAGPTGALEGYQDGDVDERTAHGDYSAYVLAAIPVIHDWIVAHPGWMYRPPANAQQAS